MKNLPRIQAIIFLCTFICGCAFNVPVRTTINDFVLMGIKTNSSQAVTFTFESNVVDGKQKPVDNNHETVSAHPGWIVNESTTLGAMLNEYMNNKFLKLNQGTDLSIKVVLETLEIMQGKVPGQSTGTAILEGLAGIGQGMFEVRLSLLLEIDDGNDKKVKRLSVTTQDTYSTATTAPPPERVLGGIIEKANNKVLMLINSYFEELGI